MRKVCKLRIILPVSQSSRVGFTEEGEWCPKSEGLSASFLLFALVWDFILDCCLQKIQMQNPSSIRHYSNKQNPVNRKSKMYGFAW
jgi:hypothetical protein